MWFFITQLPKNSHWNTKRYAKKEDWLTEKDSYEMVEFPKWRKSAGRWDIYEYTVPFFSGFPGSKDTFIYVTSKSYLGGTPQSSETQGRREDSEDERT